MFDPSQTHGRTGTAAVEEVPRPCFRAEVVAEVGVNHDGSLTRALELVEAAHAAGADVVKFQTFKAEKVTSIQAPPAAYQRENSGMESAAQVDLLRPLELAESDFRRIASHCEHLGIEFLSTPFDAESATFLCGLGVRRFKVGSGDLTNLPLLERVGGFRLPVILSTGMAYLEEIDEAIETLEGAGAPEIVLLHCVSRYPTPLEDLQLSWIPRLRSRFQKPVGFSDHSVGLEAVLVARALGACVIEKHLTLDRSRPGPDHAASTDPEGLREMVGRLRVVEEMLGSGERTFHPEEVEIREVVRKSVVALQDIPEGEVLTEKNLGLLRPGTGIQPREWEEVLGRRAACHINRGETVRWDQIL